MTMIATQARRISRLLGLDPEQPPAAEVQPTAASVGAIDAVAYELADGTRASVYEFEDWRRADAAESQLRGTGTDHRATSVNGLLVLLAIAPADADPDGLDDLVSRFAGRE